VGIGGTSFTHVENVVTFFTSDVTNFTEKNSLNHGFKMMWDTWTFWDGVSVSFTDGTVTIHITFFTSIWARWTVDFINIIMINWTVTIWSVDSVTRTLNTFGSGGTGFTPVWAFNASTRVIFIVSILAFTSWGVNSERWTSDTLAWGGSFTSFTMVFTWMWVVSESNGGN